MSISTKRLVSTANRQNGVPDPKTDPVTGPGCKCDTCPKAQCCANNPAFRPEPGMVYLQPGRDLYGNFNGRFA